MKKLLALILAVVMILSVSAVAVTAEEYEISDEFLNAVREDYGDYTIEKDDIFIEYMRDLGNDSYLVKYGAGDYAYTDDMVAIGLGSYIITTSRPVPVIYFNKRMFTLEEAYDNLILTEKELEKMLTFDGIYVEKSKVTLALKEAKHSYKNDDFINVLFTLVGSEKTFFDFYEYGVVSTTEAGEQYKAYCDELHEKFLREVLSGVDYIDRVHNNGISVVSIKKQDIEKISQSDMVVLMDYVSDAHMKYIETYNASFKDYTYREKRSVYDENRELSYILINAYSNMCATAQTGFRIGDVVMHSYNIHSEFVYQYGLYDVKEDKIYDLFDLRKTPEKYYKLEENLVNFCGGIPIGDSNGDGKVTVLDATVIQRVVASLERLHNPDHYVSHKDNESGYISDYDGDGEISVLDATCIQRKVAGLQ